jgi:hypothetical protein
VRTERLLRIVWVVGLLLVSHTGETAPKAKPPTPRPTAASAELTKFANEMAASFDEVYARVAAAKQLDAGGKFAEAGAMWRGIYEGAKLLTQNAQRAGAAGAFQDPMKFATKAGKLTPATYLTQLQKLQASGDVGWAKATVHEDQARAKQARVTYVASIAAQVSSLEAIATDATSMSKRYPEPARIALQNVARGAAGIRTSVTNAAKQKRAASDATYPIRPKAMSASELATRLTKLEKDARTTIAAIDKASPPRAAKPQPAPARVGGKPTANTAEQAPATSVEPASADQPEAAACSPAGETHCDDTNMHAPCCEGTRCLPAGWVTNGTDAEHFPTVEPEYYACQDPDLAPKR